MPLTTPLRLRPPATYCLCLCPAYSRTGFAPTLASPSPSTLLLLRPAAAWSAAASVHVVLSTLSVDQVAHRSDQCKLNAEGKREKERGRDSARVRKGRQAIR